MGATTDLHGGTAVVTGAATGLGRALALEAARRGLRVIVADVNDGGETVERVAALGGTAESHRIDVSDYSSMERLAATVRDRFGGLTLLVNNAVGGGDAGGLDTVDPKQTETQFAVNILGVFNGIRAFADDLKRAAAGGSAYILNVGSEHSLGVPPHVTPISTYTAAKYAVLGLTDTARRDFAGTGVGVSLLAPGWVRTERVEEYMAHSPEFRQAVEPYAQQAEVVARVAFDGLLAGEPLIVTNPKSVPFAREHAQQMLAALDRAESRSAPA